MDHSEADILRAEVAALRAEFAKLTECLNALLGQMPSIPPDATAAHVAREAARLRGFYWVHEFAAVIGRHRQFVSDRCTAGVIRTMRGGKPYRIPLEESQEWN